MAQLARLRSIVDLLAPPLCLCCRSPLGPAGSLCERCEAEIAMAPPVRLRADAIDGGLAALPYTGAGRRLVAALKFSRLTVAAEIGARLIAARAPAGLLAGAVVPVPAAPLRTVRRGVDPTHELAGGLGGLAGLPVRPLLRRRDLAHQRGRSRRQRLSRPPSVTALGVADPEVLLVDDVVTTGATVDACATALRRAGAERVTAVAIAAVIPRRSPRTRGRK